MMVCTLLFKHSLQQVTFITNKIEVTKTKNTDKNRVDLSSSSPFSPSLYRLHLICYLSRNNVQSFFSHRLNITSMHIRASIKVRTKRREKENRSTLLMHIHSVTKMTIWRIVSAFFFCIYIEEDINLLQKEKTYLSSCRKKKD